jgi:hypothetical protein
LTETTATGPSLSDTCEGKSCFATAPPPGAGMRLDGAASGTGGGGGGGIRIDAVSQLGAANLSSISSSRFQENIVNRSNITPQILHEQTMHTIAIFFFFFLSLFSFFGSYLKSRFHQSIRCCHQPFTLSNFSSIIFSSD